MQVNARNKDRGTDHTQEAGMVEGDAADCDRVNRRERVSTTTNTNTHYGQQSLESVYSESDNGKVTQDKNEYHRVGWSIP